MKTKKPVIKIINYMIIVLSAAILLCFVLFVSGINGFVNVFFGLFGLENKMSAAILLWRILTLYMPILIGIFFAQRIGGAREREEKAKILQQKNEAKLTEEIREHNDN